MFAFARASDTLGFERHGHKDSFPEERGLSKARLPQVLERPLLSESRPRSPTDLQGGRGQPLVASYKHVRWRCSMLNASTPGKLGEYCAANAKQKNLRPKQPAQGVKLVAWCELKANGLSFRLSYDLHHQISESFLALDVKSRRHSVRGLDRLDGRFPFGFFDLL